MSVMAEIIDGKLVLLPSNTIEEYGLKLYLDGWANDVLDRSVVYGNISIDNERMLLSD